MSHTQIPFNSQVCPKYIATNYYYFSHPKCLYCIHIYYQRFYELYLLYFLTHQKHLFSFFLWSLNSLELQPFWGFPTFTLPFWWIYCFLASLLFNKLDQFTPGYLYGFWTFAMFNWRCFYQKITSCLSSWICLGFGLGFCRFHDEIDDHQLDKVLS